ncbi:MAG: ATP-dependent helicase/nuclease subunit, partial [Gaiellaceae bacterium]|nr:ATP-dependent helicase/nuclease subunit [Gaiellaceae bacterium]
MNEQQQAAIEATGEVFVSAGAGTGKTAVLVERFVRAVCDRGLDVDSILVITYTRRAAGELRTRIRAALAERGRQDLARELDGAWISTIHGFCLRLLKSYPFAAGLDPRFRELDDAQGAVLRSEAFKQALAEFCADDEPDRLRLLATYGADGLRRMLTGVYETLRSAGRDLDLAVEILPELEGRAGELREAARSLADDASATELQRGNAEQVLALLERDTRPDRLMDLSGFRASGERAASYEEARKAVEQAALDEAAIRDRVLLQELLTRFAAAYGEAKARESALDFEDLQLHARNLLRDNESIRERESLRFRSIMVDEFQDTNRLQCDLVDLLRTPEAEVFFVGDEFQSIYGFRHADVGVFRARRAQAAQLLPLTRNYRSRAEVLAAVNELFGAHFGDEFQPLHAGAEFPDPVFGHPVELLVTDKASYKDSGVHWRRGEARSVARRVRELVDTGAATPGEIVLLFAAGTDAEWYEDELRKAGLPTYRATGKGYFGQQQVADLLAYLRLLHNRYDDKALLSVLASPFVGLSNDALALLRRAASKRPLFSGIERALPPGLSQRDERLLLAFRQRFDRLAAAHTRLSLERLCERIVSEHDYDLAVLAQWDGRRRYANMRKLARLARSYEELRGPDIEGFVRFVAEQQAVGARELEAVAEEEGADVVRLLTIHAAKGLEFKVVIVADAGRDKAPPSPDEILALSDGRFGFRVADPVTTKRRGAFDYDEVREARRLEEQAEKLRLYYVAMTRAKERLIVSGSIDREKAADASTPIGWVLGRLDADEQLAAAGDVPLEIERNDARLVVRIDRHRESDWVAAEEPSEAEEAPDEGQLALFTALDAIPAALSAPQLPALVAPAEPPLHRTRRLSFTALSTFDQCSYKYYAIRVAGMSERRPDRRGEGDGGLRATEIGDATHRLLEQVDL